MTSSAPFVLPKARALADGVTALPGAKLYFFTAGTSNALTVYQDSACTTPHAIPVVADSAGRFAPIYTPNGVSFKYELRDSAGTLTEQADNVPGPFDPTSVTVDFAKLKAPILAKTSSYTITASDLGKTITGDTTAGSIAFTLPSAAASADKTIIVEKLGSTNSLTLQAASGDTIYGPSSSGSTFQLSFAGEWVMLVAASGQWRVLSNRPVPSSITSDLLASAISGAFMKAGVVVAWPAAHASIPTGYLYCDGSAISRSTYAELFGVIGTFYGAGDGSTTFNLPDYRGLFHRGQADGQSTDPDRASRTNRGDGTTGDAVGTKQDSATVTHTHTATSTFTGNAISRFLAAGSSQDGSLGTAVPTGSGNTNVTPTGAVATTVANYSGSTETRPINIYVRYYIFAGSSIAAGASSAISTLLNGLGGPSDSLGANGDFYIDRASGKIWGAKASGTWAGTSFRIAITQGRPWKFSTSTTDADPGAGYLRLNSATMASVSQMFVSETDGDGNSAATLLAGWLGLGSSGARGTLTIEKVMAAGTYAAFLVTGSLTDAGAYDKITLAHLGSAGTFAADDVVTVGFTPAGSVGATGATGPNVGLDYTWSTSTSGDPGSGKLLVNNATPASATQLNISETNRRSASQATYIASWDDSTNASARGTIRIVDVADPGANFLEYLVTGAMTDAGAYDTFPVTYQGGAGTIANGTIVSVAFFRAGDAGSYAPGGTDVAVADGGTGRSSHTAYAVLCGGTTTTAAQQSIASVGTAGQVLTSNGAGALPTFQAAAGGVTPASLQNFRLSLTSGSSVTTGDVTAATSVYLTPHIGNQIALYNGSTWDVLSSAEVSLSLSGLTANTNYDVFAYNSSGTVTLEGLAWTNDTTRATALVRQDGVWCKTGALTRRYVGTLRITGTTGQCEDSLTKRYLFNANNRIKRPFRKIESTGSWTYTINSFRSLNNSTSNRVEMVVGLDEDIVSLVMLVGGSHGTGANAGIGIGLDSTSTNSASLFPNGTFASAFIIPWSATFEKNVGVGYHYLQMLEIAASTGTTTFYGTATLSFFQGGCAGHVVG